MTMYPSTIGLAQFRVFQRQRMVEALKTRALTWQEANIIADRIWVSGGMVKLYYRQRLIFKGLEKDLEALDDSLV